jgi:hypothetical protein
MFINITNSKEAANKGSSSGLVHYLEKENRLYNKEEPSIGLTAGRLESSPTRSAGR